MSARSLALACAIVPFALVGCAEPPASDELLAAAEDIPATPTGKADASWDVAPTLHVGTRAFGAAATGGRQVYPVWIAGQPSAPVALDVRAIADEGSDVRVAVLGPLHAGTRPVLAAGGYAVATAHLELAVDVRTAGEHLIVVGSHELATDTFFHVETRCEGCAPGAVDVLASPKAGALVATENGNLVQAELGDVLAGRTFDVDLELWAAPPMQPWNAQRVAVSVASGSQANVLVPSSVRAGDDLTLVVREAGGRVLDTGVVTRFFPEATLLVRTDAILYGDLVSLQVAGVAGFYEGHATMSLRAEDRHVEIAAHHLATDQPGHVGNGFNGFDATFAPEIFLAGGAINPNLPRNGELLSVGFINGNGDYDRLGCFEYCNDLSGLETCTGGPRPCPSAAW